VAARTLIITLLALAALVIAHQVFGILFGLSNFLVDTFYDNVKNATAQMPNVTVNATALDASREKISTAFNYLAMGWNMFIAAAVVVVFIVLFADAARRRPEEEVY